MKQFIVLTPLTKHHNMLPVTRRSGINIAIAMVRAGLGPKYRDASMTGKRLRPCDLCQFVHHLATQLENSCKDVGNDICSNCRFMGYPSCSFTPGMLGHMPYTLISTPNLPEQTSPPVIHQHSCNSLTRLRPTFSSSPFQTRASKIISNQS